MSSSNSIETHRMRKRYRELTDKDEDFWFFSFMPRPRRCCWDEQIAIPETRVFRKKMKKDSQWRKMNTPPLPPQACQIPLSCHGENEHKKWNLLLELFCQVPIGVCVEPQVDESATARVALSCHFALDSSLEAIKVTDVEFLQDGGRGSSPSLSISTNCARADLFG